MKTEIVEGVPRQKSEAIQRERERLKIQFHKEEMEKEVNQLRAMEKKRNMEKVKLRSTRKEIEKQQDQLKHLTDLRRNNQLRELSEALGLSEEQPIEVLDAFVAVEKGKIAITERRTLAARQEQLIRYQVEARDQAGQLLKHESLLKGHINALKKQKEALEKLEGCGGKYVLTELEECNQQLEQLQAKLKLAQDQLKSCKEKFEEYKEEFGKCLDEMNKCEETLSLSQQELIRCLDRLMELRIKLVGELSFLDGRIWRLSEYVNQTMGFIQRVGYWLRLRNSQEMDELKIRKTELERCSKELKGTESALTKCQDNLKEFEMELSKLKKCIKEAVIHTHSHSFDNTISDEHTIPSPLNQPCTGDQPTQLELIRFRGKEGRINIPQQISTNSYKFGILLLEDNSGAIIRNIMHECRDNPEQINTKVLEEWVAGRGKQPVSWDTLIGVLQDIELDALARDIAAVKC